MCTVALKISTETGTTVPKDKTATVHICACVGNSLGILQHMYYTLFVQSQYKYRDDQARRWE